MVMPMGPLLDWDLHRMRHKVCATRFTQRSAVLSILPAGYLPRGDRWMSSSTMTITLPRGTGVTPLPAESRYRADGICIPAKGRLARAAS
jgi:hypothetical protein